jgi:hypothetical protein
MGVRPPLHITGPYMLRPFGARATKNRSRATPLCGFSPPHFCGCWKPAVSFIETAKTSYTAGTLYEIFRSKIEEN